VLIGSAVHPSEKSDGPFLKPQGGMGLQMSHFPKLINRRCFMGSKSGGSRGGGSKGGSSGGSSGGSKGGSSGGRGQGNGGGWPSSTGNPSGGGRSNK